MTQKTDRVGRPALLAAALAALVLLAVLLLGAMEARQMLRQALSGRRERETHVHVSQFTLREQMNMEQAEARVRGWQSVVETETVSLNTERGKLRAQLFSPIQAQENAPWALVFHGGLGTDQSQVRDIACKLSLEGYRVLTPDLYAHGNSDGEISSLGLTDSRDVLAWIDWVMREEMDARMVLFGQDEGGVAVLLAAAQGLPQGVAAAAVDSAYLSVQTRAHELLAEVETSWLGKYLLDPAYRVAHGVDIREGDLSACMAQIDVPLLLIHGTGDEEVLAWQSEALAEAAGESAQLLLVEGAAHGMARFLDAELYHDTLLGFYKRALQP